MAIISLVARPNFAHRAFRVMKKQKRALSQGGIACSKGKSADRNPPAPNHLQNLYGKRIENAVLNNGEQYCSDRNPSTGIAWGIPPLPGGKRNVSRSKFLRTSIRISVASRLRHL